MINGHGEQFNLRKVGVNIALGGAKFITPKEVFITHATEIRRLNTHGMHRIVEIKPNGEYQGVNAITTCIISVVSEIIKLR